MIKNKNFTYLWISQILSQVTVNMMNFLLLTKLFDTTKSSIATSLLWVTYALPSVFIGPIGAASVDLISRRKTLMITNLLQAFTVFGYFFFHNKSIFLLYFVVLTYSFLNQFYVPAESASLPSVVGKKNLSSANSLFFITQQAALLAGFGFGGIIERLITFDGALILCAIFLFIAFVSVSFLPEIPLKTKVPSQFDKIFKTFIKSIGEGYSFIKSNKSVMFPLLLLLIQQIYLAIITANLPVIGSQILKVGLNYSGLFVVVPAGIGAFLGSFYVPREIKKKVRKKVIIERGSLIAGISVLILSIGVSYIPVVYRLISSFVLVTMVGFGYVLSSIPTLTFLQEVTPVEIRGRVFGNMWFLVTILTIFPVLLSGFLTEFLGVRVILFLMSVSSLTVYYFLIKRGQKVIEEEFFV